MTTRACSAGSNLAVRTNAIVAQWKEAPPSKRGQCGLASRRWHKAASLDPSFAMPRAREELLTVTPADGMALEAALFRTAADDGNIVFPRDSQKRHNVAGRARKDNHLRPGFVHATVVLVELEVFSGLGCGGGGFDDGS